MWSVKKVCVIRIHLILNICAHLFFPSIGKNLKERKKNWFIYSFFHYIVNFCKTWSWFSEICKRWFLMFEVYKTCWLNDLMLQESRIINFIWRRDFFQIGSYFWFFSSYFVIKMVFFLISGLKWTFMFFLKNIFSGRVSEDKNVSSNVSLFFIVLYFVKIIHSHFLILYSIVLTLIINFAINHLVQSIWNIYFVRGTIKNYIKKFLPFFSINFSITLWTKETFFWFRKWKKKNKFTSMKKIFWPIT